MLSRRTYTNAYVNFRRPLVVGRRGFDPVRKLKTWTVVEINGRGVLKLFVSEGLCCVIVGYCMAR